MSTNDDRLISGLRALPQLAPPPDLTGTVMARIARIEPPPPPAAQATSPWTTLVLAAAGITSVVPGYAAASFIGPIEIVAANGVAADPHVLSMAAVLVMTLGVYVTGLYWPLGGATEER